MNPQRLVRPGTPMDVLVLALMALVLSLGCLLSAAFPIAGDAPRTMMAVFGAVGIAVTVALLLAAGRVPAFCLHAVVMLLVAFRGVMVAEAATERGLMLSALGFLWTAVYVAFFFRPQAARAYAALITVTLGLSLLLARAPTDVSVWITISAMVWVAVAILASLNTRLRAEAQSDGLTGLLNRTGFAAAAARQRAMARRRNEIVAIAVIDLDDFKDVNDRDGHAAGDRLLAELAAAWGATLRPGDLLARFGGDEFVLMLTVAAENQVETVLTRLRRAHPAPWTAGAVVCADDEPLDEAIHRADRRLYDAKAFVRGEPGWEPRSGALRAWQADHA